MSPSVSVPPRPAVALPPVPRLRLFGVAVRLVPGLWAWPLVLTLVFVVGVMAWLRAVEHADREAQVAAMISDALSLEAQINGRLDSELTRMKVLADGISGRRLGPDAFARHPMVLDGLRRFWVSVTWIGNEGRIMATVPEETPAQRSAAQATLDDVGLTGHLHLPLTDGKGRVAGALVVRYSTSELLRQKVPWWLASRYDVRLVDDLGGVYASTQPGPRTPEQAWYRVSMGPTLPQAWLELSARDRIPPWWRTLPVALMGGFVLLLFATSAMLRRQMRSVSRAEEAWRTEAAWRTAMEDSLAVGLRARDLDGRLVYVNKTMADMVGYQPEELVGLLPPMPYWLPDEIGQSMTRHLRNMAGKAPRMGYESRWQHRDGRVVDVMIFEAPLVDAKGQQIGWMASVLNITERKQMEERERRQMEAMAHQARLTMLGEVASTLAHELNQPLTVIASYNAGVINALSRQPEADPQLLKALQRMGEQAAHAGRIVKRIREFLTRREPQLEPCGLPAVIESGMALLRKDIARLNVELAMDCPANLPQVVADPVLLEQVVVNLVRNACDAVGAQDGPRRVSVRVACLPADDGERARVRVCVEDNGPGLGGRTTEQICAPFFSTKAEGMGMGLAICRSIIELHYGTMEAAERPGGGASLCFTLPVADGVAEVESEREIAGRKAQEA
ncbi:PAS domain S-box protein [uncultured Aquabacterium sp.]|uniref:sensor histidine kinase n=1 Tax=uncultured Aquabacterium sp. TaxID=158753 RepID=UPI0026396590|nr:PAS domain S-box protein [uncultured Aquabacterium sp.]